MWFKYPNLLNRQEASRSMYLLKTRTTRTPAFWGYPPPHNDYPYHWVILDPKSKEDKVKVANLKKSPKFQFFEFWNGHYTRHTFWSCLIRCANMKWIRWVLLKIQSGHDSVHRRTDGQTDKVIPVYPPFNFVEAGGIIISIFNSKMVSDQNARYESLMAWLRFNICWTFCRSDNVMSWKTAFLFYATKSPVSRLFV